MENLNQFIDKFTKTFYSLCIKNYIILTLCNQFLLISDDSKTFRCKNKQRIPKSKVCDKVVDCEDGTDESNCGASEFKIYF